jgi:hypothetical protein
LTFNLKVRVARSFAIIFGLSVTIYTAESLASVAGTASMSEFWLRLPMGWNRVLASRLFAFF